MFSILPSFIFIKWFQLGDVEGWMPTKCRHPNAVCGTLYKAMDTSI
jgi:hypothetical protein